MRTPVTTIYAGRKFTLLSSGYFLDNNKKAEERLLHRLLWIAAFGPIPKGFDVHHKDENKQNNSLDNFELKPRSLHRRDHMLQLLGRDPVLRQKLVKQLLNARVNCHNWLHTDLGKDWARGQLARTREKLRDYVCAYCGVTFTASVIARHKFCNRACASKFYYAKRKARLSLLTSVSALLPP